MLDDAGSVRQNAEAMRAALREALAVEHYGVAAELRDDLANLQNDDARVTVLDANEKFFAALRKHDETSLAAVWPEHGPLASECSRAYPGFAPLRGRERILDCWRQTTSDRHTQVGDLHCVVLRGGASAIVTCVEWRLGWLLDGSAAMPADEDDTLATTNLFERAADGSWRLVLHTAWPLALGAGSDADDGDEVEYDADDFPGATG